MSQRPKYRTRNAHHKPHKLPAHIAKRVALIEKSDYRDYTKPAPNRYKESKAARETCYWVDDFCPRELRQLIHTIGKKDQPSAIGCLFSLMDYAKAGNRVLAAKYLAKWACKYPEVLRAMDKYFLAKTGTNENIIPKALGLLKKEELFSALFRAEHGVSVLRVSLKLFQKLPTICPRLLDPMIEWMLRLGNFCRFELMQLFSRFQSSRGFERLRAYAQHTDPKVRIMALQSYPSLYSAVKNEGKLRHRKLILSDLHRLLEDKHPKVVRNAWHVLDRIRDYGAVAEFEPRILCILFQAIQQNFDQTHYQVKEIWKAAERFVGHCIAFWSQHILQQSTSVDEWPLGFQDLLPAFFQRVLRPMSVSDQYGYLQVQQQAIQSIGRLESLRISFLPLLIERSSDPYPEIKKEAFSVLVSMMHEDIDLLFLVIQAQYDHFVEIREVARKGIKSLDSVVLAQKLLKGLACHKTYESARQAFLFQTFHCKKALECLYQATSRFSGEAKAVLVLSLGRSVHGKLYKRFFIHQLKDPHQEVRTQALYALLNQKILVADMLEGIIEEIRLRSNRCMTSALQEDPPQHWDKMQRLLNALHNLLSLHSSKVQQSPQLVDQKEVAALSSLLAQAQESIQVFQRLLLEQLEEKTQKELPFQDELHYSLQLAVNAVEIQERLVLQYHEMEEQLFTSV